MNRVLILGIDGYIGWTLANHLIVQKDKYQVCGLDNLSRRKRVKQIGSNSLTPIESPEDRFDYIKDYSNFFDVVCKCNLHDPYIIERILGEYHPNTIVHLAEQPSAPYSMKNVNTSIDTQVENLKGTLALLWAMRKHCPDAHLLKLGTMGEYGTPNCDIPEGRIHKDCADRLREITCPMSGLMFPRTPGSFYHASKVHDTINIEFACRSWGLRSTDVMQGVVFGLEPYNIDYPVQRTRFDYDQYFGTAINRFCVQAICDMPLSVYGDGTQTRGYLTLSDSIKCLTLAIDNPPDKGEYRTFNQFESIYSLNRLAANVHCAATELGLESVISHIPNPRAAVEAQNHYYNPTCQHLLDLGYEPNTDIYGEIVKLFNTLLPFKDRIIKSVIMPTTVWR